MDLNKIMQQQRFKEQLRLVQMVLNQKIFTETPAGDQSFDDPLEYVKSLNSLLNAVTIAGDGGIIISVAGQTITVDGSALLAIADLTTYPRVADPFKEGTHSGLDFAYGIGRVRDDTVITNVAAGTITLADAATNYIEVDPSTGTVSANTTGYTTGRIPLYEATTAAGDIVGVQDDRCFLV